MIATTLACVLVLAACDRSQTPQPATATTDRTSTTDQISKTDQNQNSKDQTPTTDPKTDRTDQTSKTDRTTPAHCPKTLAEAQKLGVRCNRSTAGCSYPEGSCGCGYTCSGAAIGDRPPVWICWQIPAGCPKVAPRENDACTTEGLTCTYQYCAFAGIACEGGIWRSKVWGKRS